MACHKLQMCQTLEQKIWAWLFLICSCNALILWQKSKKLYIIGHWLLMATKCACVTHMIFVPVVKIVTSCHLSPYFLPVFVRPCFNLIQNKLKYKNQLYLPQECDNILWNFCSVCVKSKLHLCNTWAQDEIFTRNSMVQSIFAETQ